MQNGARVGVAAVGLFLDVMEGVKHQQCQFQRIGGDTADFGVVKQLDQRADVVSAEHRAKQLGGLGARDQRAFFATESHGGQIGGLDLGGVIDTSGHTVGDQVDQRLTLACGRVLEQLDQLGGLVGGQGQGGDAKGSAFCDMAAVGF